jgi:hypothetical protein
MVPLSLLVRNVSSQEAGQNIEKAAYAIAGRLSSRLSKKLSPPARSSTVP